MELRGWESSGRHNQESYFQCGLQRLRASRLQRRATVHHQERYDRARGNSQRTGAKTHKGSAEEQTEEIKNKEKVYSCSSQVSDSLWAVPVWKKRFLATWPVQRGAIDM